MRKDLYNSTDEEYKHVIKLLNELPRVKAPDNLEYNLKVKIENKQFELNSKEFRPFLPWKILLPASSAVVMAILFFTFFIDSDNLENPFHIQPKLRNEISSNILNTDSPAEKLGNSNIISENDVIILEKGSNSETDQSPKSVTPEVNALAEFPFDPSNSTNLDDIISNDEVTSNIGNRANLVGRSSNNSSFDGFFIREEINKKEFEALKARNDSLIRVLKERKANNRY